MKQMFSKEEVEKIVKDNAPKLYIHNINFNCKFDDETIDTSLNLKILNNSKTPFDISILQTLIDDGALGQLTPNCIIELGYVENLGTTGKFLKFEEDTVTYLASDNKIYPAEIYLEEDDEISVTFEDTVSEL